MIDLDDFPKSAAAKEMLSYVTHGWYDRSYVGKWLYEIMGMELDAAAGYIEMLPEQLFPETATWGIAYHEMKYGLPVRNDLPLEERRRLICEKRDTRAPMTPWKMERYLKSITGYDVKVEDINEPGSKIKHPNVFEVSLQGSGEIDLAAALKKLRSVKQSHTSFVLKVVSIVHIELNRNMQGFKVKYRNCGTYPNRSVERRETESGLLVAPLAKGHKRRVPLSGASGATGQYPTTSKKLEIAGSMIETAAQAEGYHVLYPNTDKEFRDGTYPKAASSASYADPLIEADVKATGCKYQNVSAGSVPYTDTGLSLERANTEIEPSGTGIEVIYTAAGEGETGVIPVPSNGLEESGDTVIPGVRTEKYQVRYKLCGNTLEI